MSINVLSHGFSYDTIINIVLHLIFLRIALRTRLLTISHGNQIRIGLQLDNILEILGQWQFIYCFLLDKLIILHETMKPLH